MTTVNELRDELDRVKAVHRRQQHILQSENQLLRDELSSLLAHVSSLHAKLQEYQAELETCGDRCTQSTSANVACQCDILVGDQPVNHTCPSNSEGVTSGKSESPSPATLAGEADRLLHMISKLRSETTPFKRKSESRSQ